MQPKIDSVDAISWLRRARLVPSIDALAATATLQPWLELTSSLTRELHRTFEVKPRLTLLGEGLEPGSDWERYMLAANEPIYARHIALSINDTPIVLARSVTTQGPGMNALTNLHTRPLAELLFEDSLWRRQVETRYLLLEKGSPGRGCLWQNQDLGARLIVQEFFLGELPIRPAN